MQNGEGFMQKSLLPPIHFPPLLSFRVYDPCDVVFIYFTRYIYIYIYTRGGFNAMKFSIQLFLSSLDDNFSREKRKITIFSFQMGYLRKLILSFGKFLPDERNYF